MVNRNCSVSDPFDDDICKWVDECTDHSQARDFVDLHEQVEVRTMLTTITPASESLDLSGKCKSSGFSTIISVYVSKGPLLRIRPDIRITGKEHRHR